MLIQLKNIVKSYKIGSENYKALKGISFNIDKGEMVAIIGPSGSGKSTTMHILGCLDSADSGEYILNSKNVSKLADSELAKIRSIEIGFVFQSFNLLPRTNVLNNVCLPLTYQGVPKTDRELRGIEALKKVGLLDKKNNKSNQLSGGQIQRVAIARAIVTNPSIILADEPTGNLDTKTSHEVMEIFKQMNKEGKTVVIITHEMEIANYCKRIIKLKDGMIEEDSLNTFKTK